MKRAAIYGRVSTKRQEEEETIESQIGAIQEKIKLDGNMTDSSLLYKDEGYSGSLIERPDLDKLRGDAKLGKFEVVYIFDYGRISRDLTDLMLIKDEIEANGVQVISLFERITGDAAIDRLLLQIMGAVYEYERKKTAQRFLNGKLQKAKRGQLVGYNGPYGYDYHPLIKSGPGARDGYFTVNKKEAEVIKKIFEWVASGVSLREVIKRLHEENIPPKKHKRAAWSKGPLGRLLRNESYITKHYFNKNEATMVKNPKADTKYRRVVKTSRVLRPKKDWIPIKVPRIIDDNLFYQVQKQLDLNQRYSQRNNNKNRYLLTGLLECTCGKSRTGDPGNRSHLYYRCTDRLSNYPLPRECFEASVNATVLDALVWKKTYELLTNPKIVSRQAERWLKSQNDRTANQKGMELSEKLKKLNDEERKYAKALGAGSMREDIYYEQIKDVSDRRQSLELKFKEVSAQVQSQPKLSIEETITGVQRLIQKLDFTDKKFIVRRIITKIIATQKEVVIWGQIPILATEQVGLDANDWNCRVAECW